MPRPVAFSATIVGAPGAGAVTQPQVLGDEQAGGKNSSSPITGTTKKPTMPARPATTSERCGHTGRPGVLRRDDHQVTVAPAASRTAQTANTSQAAGVPVNDGPGEDREPDQDRARQHRDDDADQPDENGQSDEQFQHDFVLLLHDDCPIVCQGGPHVAVVARVDA